MSRLLRHLAGGLDPVILARNIGMECDAWQAEVLRRPAPRELRSCLELQARLTGELDERPSMTVNLLASTEIQGLVGLLLSALAPFPEARIAAAGALSTIDAGAGS